MISNFYNDGYSIIMFTNSTAHVQRKETGIQGMLFSANKSHGSNGSRKFCMCYGNYMFAFRRAKLGQIQGGLQRTSQDSTKGGLQ